MSMTTIIKDYVDVLNNLYDSLSTDITLKKVIFETFTYLFETFKICVFYLLSFQWLRDFVYLPLLVPKISNSIFKEDFFFENPVFNLFSLFQISTYNSNKFLIGFLNSFFLSLPISTAHLIWIRRLLIQGIPAGLASGLGLILGQFLFIGSVIFGLRFLIIPFFSLAPLTYIFGILLIFSIIFDMFHERQIKRIPFSETTKKTLFQIFFLNFALIWTQQNFIFHYLGNLTFDVEPTILQFLGNQTFFDNIFYLFGILFGNLFFTFVFGFLIQKLNDFLSKSFSIMQSRWLQRLNRSILVLTILFAFNSTPYYSFEYLFTNKLGFVPGDISLQNFKLFSESKYFDKDFYDFRIDAKEPHIHTFENLNYRGERAFYYGIKRKKYSDPKAKKAKNTISKFMESLTKSSSPTGSKKLSLEQKNNFSKRDQIAEKSSDLTNNSRDEKLSTFTNLSKEEKDFDIKNLTPLEDEIFEKGNPKFFSVDQKKQLENRFEDISKTQFLFDNEETNFFNRFVKTKHRKIEDKLKETYYSNPIYKILLSVDIDSFLGRQPTSHFLNAQQEKELFEKRLLLSKYYDTLRDYKHFGLLTNGSKSYADRVYNQQFKGTLRIVRRLFSVSLNEEQNEKQNLVLKFDQPLYTKKNENTYLHEELKKTELKNTESKQLQTPFITRTYSTPFYAGWDTELRKFVLTNRFVSKDTAGLLFDFNSIPKEKNYSIFNKLIDSNKKIEFTAWPIPKEILDKNDLSIPYSVIYESLDNPSNKKINDFLLINCL